MLSPWNIFSSRQWCQGDWSAPKVIGNHKCSAPCAVSTGKTSKQSKKRTRSKGEKGVRQGLAVFQIPSCAVLWHSPPPPKETQIQMVSVFVPLQLSLQQMTAGHRCQGKTCSYCSDLQRNFSSLFRSAWFLCHRLPAHPASPSTCCQGSKSHTASVSYFSPFLPHWKEWEKQIWSKAKIKQLQGREILWIYNNHWEERWHMDWEPGLPQLCRAPQQITVLFTLPHVTSLYTRTHSSLTATSLCLLFHKKHSVLPNFGFSNFCCN